MPRGHFLIASGLRQNRRGHAGRVISGTRGPSTTAAATQGGKPQTAARIAWDVAASMPIRSIRRDDTRNTDQASAWLRIVAASSVRAFGGNSLESRRRAASAPMSGRNTTAAATTGPARGPRPASSIPATGPLAIALARSSTARARAALWRSVRFTSFRPHGHPEDHPEWPGPAGRNGIGLRLGGPHGLHRVCRRGQELRSLWPAHQAGPLHPPGQATG